MDTNGTHLLIEYHGCNTNTLNHVGRIEAAMWAAAEAAGATVVTATFHRFAPQGVSGVVVVEESHLSIHTWPESGYAAVDVFTCGDCIPIAAHESLRVALEAERSEVITVRRGQHEPGSSMRVHQHFSNQHCDDESDESTRERIDYIDPLSNR